MFTLQILQHIRENSCATLWPLNKISLFNSIMNYGYIITHAQKSLKNECSFCEFLTVFAEYIKLINYYINVNLKAFYVFFQQVFHEWLI